MANGWFPKISPDGTGVAFGQGDIYHVTLAAGTEQLIESGSVYAPGWIRQGVFTYQRVITSSSAHRVEVDVADMSPRVTTDDVNLVAGNSFGARDGHWASWLAGNPMRIAYDNLLIDTGTGGALSLGDDGWLSYASTNDNQALKVWHLGQFVREYPTTATPLFESAVGAGGHVLYGGHGPVHGITPDGQDTDLTIAPGRYEGVGKVFEVAGAPWVATMAWVFATETGYVLLRPFGESAAIIVSLASVSLDVVVAGDSFVIASNDDKGRLTVLIVPVNAPRQRFP